MSARNPIGEAFFLEDDLRQAEIDLIFGDVEVPQLVCTGCRSRNILAVGKHRQIR